MNRQKNRRRSKRPRRTSPSTERIPRLACVPEGWASLADLDPDAEASLTELLRLMKQERYDVIPSLSGYLVTEDPTYLPEDAVVRAMARQLGRDRMLALLITVYLRAHTDAEGS